MPMPIIDGSTDGELMEQPSMQPLHITVQDVGGPICARCATAYIQARGAKDFQEM
jgi:hypothetical protein